MILGYRQLKRWACGGTLRGAAKFDTDCISSSMRGSNLSILEKIENKWPKKLSIAQENHEILRKLGNNIGHESVQILQNSCDLKIQVFFASDGTATPHRHRTRRPRQRSRSSFLECDRSRRFATSEFRRTSIRERRPSRRGSYSMREGSTQCMRWALVDVYFLQDLFENIIPTFFLHIISHCLQTSLSFLQLWIWKI